MTTTYPVRLERVQQETPKDRTLVFRLPPGAEAAFAFQPGQYVTFVASVDEKPVMRAYSISSAPSPGDSFEVTVRNDGSYGAYLYALAPGTVLEARAPRGTFVLETPPGMRLLLTAGGSGVAPYRGFVRALVAAGRREPVALVHSARAPEELVFRQEFERTAREHAWLTYVPTITRPAEPAAWAGRVGRADAALIASLAPHPTQALLYACGPNAFVDAMVASARAAGLPPENIRRERWG